MTDTRNLLSAMSDYAASGAKDAPVIRMATIDPNHTVGRPRVLFDGETRLTEKSFTFDGAYTPRAGDRVWMMPVGSSYVISGSLADPRERLPKFLDLQYLNEWRTLNTDYGHMRVTRTAAGLVKLSGVVGNGTGGSVITVLPPGFRPNTTIRPVSLAHVPGMSASVMGGALTIHMDGRVVFSAGTHKVDWLALDDITFNNNPDLVWTVPTFVNGWRAVGDEFEESAPAAYTKDAVNRVWFSGFAARASAPAAESVAFTLPVGYRPEFAQHYNAASNTGLSGSDTTANGEFRWKAFSGTGTGFWDLSRTYYLDKAVTGWTNIAYSGNWSRYSNDHPPLSSYKDSEHVVHLRGLITGGAANSTIGYLPVGHRPKYRQIRFATSGTTFPLQRVDILPTGEIYLAQGSGGWMALDGLMLIGEQ